MFIVQITLGLLDICSRYKFMCDKGTCYNNFFCYCTGPDLKKAPKPQPKQNLLPESSDDEDETLDFTERLNRCYLEKELSFEEKCKRKYSFKSYVESNDLKEKMENYDCPICIDKIKPDQLVRGLKCSILHVYHVKCLNKLTKSNIKECSLCRVKLEIRKID
jgi:hypothetical protein